MTAPRPIVKTFNFQSGSGSDTPASLYSRTDNRWGTFQNTYAVWPTNNNQTGSYTIKRTFTASYTGTYYFRSTVDNSGSIYVDDVLIGGTVNFNQTPTRVAKTLSAGDHILKFVVSNAGDVAGIAVTISNSSDTLIWDTRTYALVTPDPDTGRYTLTMPFNGSVTMHLWGGGGGGGSGDYGGPGGKGSPGLYNMHTVNFIKGNVIEVALGSGGQPGVSGRPQIGGAAGKGRINIDSQSSKSFNGGIGGNGPVSGAGGGGGGATAVLVDGQVVAVAGGGGGGGGAGTSSNGKNASIENNVMTQSGAGTDWRGENGQSRGTDGGTGGGGGGGYPGGEGGNCNSGDSGADAGQTGGNFPTSTAQTGTNSQYYVSDIAAGGSSTSSGKPGYAVLIFTPEVDYAAISAVKVAGTWRQVTAAYVKVSGAWRTITNSYVKQNGVWRTIRSTGDKTLTEFTGQTTDYGSVARTHN